MRKAIPGLGHEDESGEKPYGEYFRCARYGHDDSSHHGARRQRRLDFEGVDVNGKKSKQTLVQPIKGGKVEGPSEADFDSAILSVPDSHHWIYSYSKNGKPVAKRIATLSEDGKTPSPSSRPSY